MPEYSDDSRVEGMVESLVKKEFTHLKAAAIKVVMKGGEVDKQITEAPQGKVPKVVKGRKVPALFEYLFGAHFIIEISRPLWDAINDLKVQEALIFDTLCRFRWDDGRPGLNDPKVVIASPEVIERYGFYTLELENLARVLQPQMSLFDQVPAGGEKQPAVTH